MGVILQGLAGNCVNVDTRPIGELPLPIVRGAPGEGRLPECHHLIRDRDIRRREGGVHVSQSLGQGVGDRDIIRVRAAGPRVRGGQGEGDDIPEGLLGRFDGFGHLQIRLPQTDRNALVSRGHRVMVEVDSREHAAAIFEIDLGSGRGLPVLQDIPFLIIQDVLDSGRDLHIHIVIGVTRVPRIGDVAQVETDGLVGDLGGVVPGIGDGEAGIPHSDMVRHITEARGERVVQGHPGRGPLHDGYPDPEGDVLADGEGVLVPGKGLVDGHIGVDGQGFVRGFRIVVQMGAARRIIILVIIHVSGGAGIPSAVRQTGVRDLRRVADDLIRRHTVHQQAIKGDRQACPGIHLKGRKGQRVPNVCGRADCQVCAGERGGGSIQNDIPAGRGEAGVGDSVETIGQRLPPVHLIRRGVAGVPDHDLPSDGVPRVRTDRTRGDRLGHLDVRLAHLHRIWGAGGADFEGVARYVRIFIGQLRLVGEHGAILVPHLIVHLDLILDDDIARGADGEGAEVEREAAGSGVVAEEGRALQQIGRVGIA